MIRANVGRVFRRVQDVSSKRIGLLFNRSRAYGRGFCEGFASYTEVRHDWRREMVEDGKVGELDGLIAHVMDDAHAEHFARLGMPVIADFYRKPRRGFAQALPDHAAVGRLAAEHFLERGFTNYAFCGYDGILFSDERRAGYAAALSERRYECASYRTPSKVLDGFNERVILREEIAPRAADARALRVWLLSLPRPCALFCCHDLRALQVLYAAKVGGLRVPEDIAILGVDNDMLVCNFTHPRLSSIDNAAFDVGRAAAKLLDDILEGRASRNACVKVTPMGIVSRASTDVFTYSSPVVNEAMLFMRRSLSQNLTASDIFAHLGKSHTFVENAFRAEVGVTVQSELQRLRLEEAKRLLKSTAMPLANIARRSGFSSPRYFAQAFRHALGVSPSAWRESQLA